MPPLREAAEVRVRPNGRESHSPSSSPVPGRVAAIDIGSNSVRQIVADVSPAGEIRVVDDMKASPRLAAGLAGSGELREEAIDRAVEIVGRMATLARQLGAERVEAVATSAVREASNADALVERLHRETGLRLRVLDGHQEALLGFRSALAHFELGSGRAAVLDIGGGSLELALSVDGLVERLESFPLGAIRLTEEFLSDTPRRRDVRKLRRRVRRTLRDHLRAREWHGAQFIGSGGTFTNLAAMSLARQEVHTAQTVHGTRVTRVELEHILDTLEGLSIEQRLEFPGLSPARADIIVAGLAVAAEVTAFLDAHEVIVSAYGIREGLLLETARVEPAVASSGEARERSVERLAEACRFEERHSRHVQRLALQLFDSIGERLGCERGDRQTLADAALLHDIGYHISYDKHHKHSYYLILHAELLGMTPADQVIVANVARYHRGARPRRKHRNFGVLDQTLRDRILRLSAILRVADGFDRGHVGAVERIRVRWMPRALRLSAVPAAPGRSVRLELWGASRKAELLSRVADVPVEIVDPDGRVVSPSDEDEPD